jgi:predicted nucleic acid-binding protein
LSVFVDTSALYGATDDDDGHCARARELLTTEEPLITTDFVLAETWRLVRDRLGHAAADRFWGSLRAGAATIEHVTPADLDAAWRIGEGFPDQAFSLVDRTSFAVMERLGVHRAVAFDDDFAVYRFGPRRERAFEVLR